MANQVNLVGVINSELKYDHEMYGEKFYNTTAAVTRDSGKTDIIPLLISERVMDEGSSLVGACVHIAGEFRSHNKHYEDKSRLILYVFVNELEILSENTNINDVFLEGHICKTPTYRHTPLNRNICDVILAVNRGYNKSDYIPCILWGRNAYYARTLNIGDSIRVAGRIQSREYIKKDEVKTAYELSVSLLELS